MLIEFSPQCQKKIKKIKTKDPVLFQKLAKQLELFGKNPDHSSLRLHKLRGAQADTWSISVNMSVRMLFYYRDIGDEKSVVFFSVGTHDQVYKK